MRSSFIRPSVEKILSLHFVRAAIERYCDHIQRYIINHGSTESGLQEGLTESATQSLTEAANRGAEGLVEGLGGATEPDEEVEEGLAEDLSGPLEAIREGTLEGTAFLNVLPASSSDQKGADVRTPNGERPASPGSEKVRLGDFRAALLLASSRVPASYLLSTKHPKSASQRLLTSPVVELRNF